MQRGQYFSLQLNQNPNGQWFWVDTGTWIPLDQRFNEVGAQGWELCSTSEDLEVNDSYLKMVFYHFKRPY